MFFRAVVHDAEEGGYWAEVPALPGCFSEGETREQLLENIKEAIRGCLAVLNSVIDTIRSTFPEEPGWANRGVKDSAGGFGEIRIPSRPAILIELAFHDDCARDAAYLVDDFFRSLCEWGIYNGICSYFGATPTWGKYSDEYVSDTIPTTMLPGQNYNVSVTMRNRGVSWFTSRGFRLGAVGESDPFASFTRVDISGEVKPGSTYTFNFTLTAPTVGGTYTTDWQMVRDGYAWFGPMVSKSIVISGDPDTEPPSVPQNLHSTSVTTSSVGLAWNASTDNAAVIGYRIYRDGAVVGTSTSPTYTDTGLSSSSAYTYEVDAYDGVPNYSAKSASIVVGTAAGVATWGPNATSECDTVIDSMGIPSDNHNGTSNNVGHHSTTAGYNEARPCFHWLGTGTNTPLNKNIVTTGGTFAHSISSVYSGTAAASDGAYMLTTAWPNNNYSDTNAMVSWLYYDYPHAYAWTTVGGDIDPTVLTSVSVSGAASYTWTWTGTHNAGCGIQMRNQTSVTDVTYRKTFPPNATKASLTLNYIPPSGAGNSCVQNWNAIGTWADTDTNLGTDFLATTDVRGVSEAGMAARTGDNYNGQAFDVTSQDSDRFNALTYGWLTNCTGYGFVYVYYDHADNSAVYLGVGSDDRFKVWLNGSMVASWLTAGGRGWVSQDDSFVGPVTLKQGWNRVLIKTQNGVGGYAWSLRFANADRSALGDCTFALTDSTAPTNPTTCTDSTGSSNNVAQKITGDPNFTWSGAADPTTSGEAVSTVKGYYYYWGTNPAGTSSAVTTTAAYDPSAVSDGTYYLRVATYDYALNTASWQTIYTFIYDSTAPSASVGSPDKSVAKSGTVVNFPVTFGESVTGFASGGVTLNTGSTATGTVGTPTGSGKTWSVPVTATAGNGTLGITVKVNAATDAAGNGNTVSSASATFLDDNTVPITTASDVTVTGQAPGVTADFLKGWLRAVITAQDNVGGSGVKEVRVKIDSDGAYGAYGAPLTLSGTNEYTYNGSIDSSWTNGSRHLTVKVTDNADNYVEVPKTFTVNKNEIGGIIGLDGIVIPN